AAVAAHSALHVRCYAPLTSTTVVIVPVVKRVAPRVVPAAAISHPVVPPIETPIAPTPSITSEETDSEAETEREIRAVKPNSGIGVPLRPRHDGTSVNQPRIIRGDVND